MLLSCFQLLVTSLRKLLACIYHILQFATSSPAISPTSPIQCEPETKEPINVEIPDDHGQGLNREPNAVSSKPSPQPHLSEEILAPTEQPLPAVRPDHVSRGAAQFDGAKVHTPSTSRKNDDSMLQRAHAVLASLFRFYVYSTLPRLNQENDVPTSFNSRLTQAFHRLNIAQVLTYVGTAQWNPERKDVEKAFDTNVTASNPVAGSPSPLPQAPFIHSGPPSPAFLTPEANALPERHFVPVHRSLLGCIEKPKGSPICAGAYSDVWQCNVRFSKPSEGLPAKVAVKVLRPVWLNGRSDDDANERLRQRFEQEIITWLGLPNHPNLVPLIGWTLTPKLSFISTWYEQGNLYRHLKGFSEGQKINVLLGIAKGLDCLHSCNPPVVHGDLKPENILLSDQGEPLLADFGLSTMVGEERMYTPSHGGGGSAPWMSPEQMIGESRSCQSDVYSFGNLAFTVMTGELPHTGLNDSQVIFKVCNSDSDGPIEDWSKYHQLQGPIKDILKDCWSRSPSERPSMSAIVRRLTPLLE